MNLTCFEQMQQCSNNNIKNNAIYENQSTSKANDEDLGVERQSRRYKDKEMDMLMQSGLAIFHSTT